MPILLTCQFNLNLYDSATDWSLPVLKAVDVSDVCFYREQGCTLLYSKAQRGPLVQIILPDNRNDLAHGTIIHFFLHELEAELQRGDTNFPRFAKELGLQSAALVKLVQMHAP